MLTPDERTQLRHFMERKAVNLAIPVSWVKSAVHDAAQAVADVLESAAFKTAISSAIDAATVPHNVTFTAVQKKALAAKVFEITFIRDQ
jgi:hypothetical protein